MKRLALFIITIMAVSATIPALSQSGVATPSDDVPEDVLVIEPLFEYPAAPDSLADLQSRTDWIMRNFWNNFDFKNSRSVDQLALNDAFGVYTAAMQYADKDVVLNSVDRLIGSIKKNPGYMLQFTKAAEENLYGPRASVWIDEVYMKFLDALINCKKLDKSRRIRYQDQYRRLSNSLVGKKMSSFKYTDRSGKTVSYRPTATVNIIEFGNPECDECRKAKNLMEIDLRLNRLMNENKVSVAFIIIDEDPDGDLLAYASSYPSKWSVGINDDIVDIIDIRDTPSFYVVDDKGNILAKNISVTEAIAIAESKSMFSFKPN